MFKIGDKVFIKEEYGHCIWYHTGEMTITYVLSSGSVVNVHFEGMRYVDGWRKNSCIDVKCLLSVRELKLKKILNV